MKIKGTFKQKICEMCHVNTQCKTNNDKLPENFSLHSIFRNATISKDVNLY